MLHCRRCGAQSILGRSERLSLLRKAGKLRRDARPDPALIDTLFEAELPRLACPECGETALEQREELPSPEDELDPEEWGEARRCVACRSIIHPDRLEILPDTRQCSACAAAGKTGEADERDFCPRCGAELLLAEARGAGLARYTSQCRSCGYRG
ncbi:hypothetical protein [Candidatus Laterigemmans baculatus]|uniref:hypothetical protein n=1 Tax=Candidatus Laterigemmans baculatus TaxID=2770505 RepID=UPI0013DA7FC4|nr:hypothetical protein [Candidatus Laterigemmans baculatus]